MPATITLKRPVEHDGKTFGTIVVDEPTVGAIEAYETAKAAGRSDIAGTLEMLAVDCGWPVDALRKMRASDLHAVTEALAPFVGATGGTGAA